MHSKIMAVRDPDGGSAHRWRGSVNFSVSGCLQANCVTLFRSDEWAEAFRYGILLACGDSPSL